MSAPHEPVVAIPEDECWQLLASRTLGRLVTSIAGQPEIFPVNFVVQRETVLFRTAEGTKLLSTVLNNRVAFEADDHNVEEGWSVVVKGRAQAMKTSAEDRGSRTHAMAPVTWAGSSVITCRIFPYEVTGRAFRFGSEPEPDHGWA